MGIEPFDCSATQMFNGSCILGVVIGDSLNTNKVNIVFFSYFVAPKMSIQTKVPNVTTATHQLLMVSGMSLRGLNNVTS